MLRSTNIIVAEASSVKSASMNDMPAVPAPMTRYFAWHSVDVVEEEILLFRSVVLEVLSDIVMYIIARGFNYGLYASIIRNISITPSKLNNNLSPPANGDDALKKGRLVS